MTEFLDLAMVVSIVIGALGAVYGWVQAGITRDVIGAAKSFAQMGACYLKIKADGNVSTDESIEMGNLTVAFFEEIETITGNQIFNDAKVPFLLPKQ